MDWNLCLICKEETGEKLRCPIDRKNSDARDVYQTFLQNVDEFRTLGALPVNLESSSVYNVETFIEKKAKWHHSCYQKFINSRLQRAKDRKRKPGANDDNVRCSKRQSIETNMALCIFCGEKNQEELHDYSTENAELSLRTMASDMNDDDLLTKLSGGDFVAIEAKYHFPCITKYRNRYRSYLPEKNKNTDFRYEQAKARAFTELISYIECGIEEGTYLFNVKELRDLYENRLKNFWYDIEVNEGAFKDLIKKQFDGFVLEKQSDGKNKIFVFPEGMQKLLRDAFKTRDYQSEALLFAKVAKICRCELFGEETAFFSGSFPEDCQQNLLPLTKSLVSMILYGPNLKEEINGSQPCNTISQLLLHNAKKQTRVAKTSYRHSYQREPPVPLYVGLSLHTQTRSKKLVDSLEKLGLSISYDRVLQLENLLAKNVCEQFKLEGIVCPDNLRKGIYTIGALDNIDHNPSSSSAQGSLHGTAISIIQNPTKENPGTEQNITFKSDIAGQPSLPESFTLVPAANVNVKSTCLPQRKMEDIPGYLQTAVDQERAWIECSMPLITDKIINEQAISWAAYHAKLQLPIIDPTAIIAMLPLFLEKADTPAMIMHGMDLLIEITDYLNPGQIPVLACDCPIFEKCKCIQWKYPEKYGEDKLIIMFGGLHLEKGLWIALGDLLASSGWTDGLVDVDVATSGTADSLIKCTHIMRTRHAHQLTVLALSALQKNAYDLLSKDSSFHDSFDKWRVKMIKKSPTFLYWDMVLPIEVLVLIFSRAHRERNFLLYSETLEAIMFIFFAVDHYNYSRWASVHLRDMKSLPEAVKEDLMKNWVVQKTSRRFSAIPLDQTHEQENAKVKGKGGVIGLTEDPVAFNGG